MIVHGTKIFNGVVVKVTRTGIVVDENGKMREYNQVETESALTKGEYSNE